MDCKICGTPGKSDLFSAVTNSPACSICTIKFIGGMPSGMIDKRITEVRAKLGLKDGEFLKQDRGEEASRILGHR